ncbi:CsbD family protein [Buttiauxella selenatireducens]|uniref:CsbD family protein n=1 Tax=Buttiauxella selenatireducens TaxID=3073902 RepID=A0ABY9SFL4_9ENTR|nr:CsbD family protein [Buttiauxella sp. R73]WMY76307.1 CsbD family protein [Buttiauxella sp. R73]
MFDKTADKVNEAAGTAREFYGKHTQRPDEELKGAARKYASQASYAVRDAADNVRDQVSTNPVAGLAIAAAVGVVFGFLLGRR